MVPRSAPPLRAAHGAALCAATFAACGSAAAPASSDDVGGDADASPDPLTGDADPAPDATPDAITADADASPDATPDATPDCGDLTPCGRTCVDLERDPTSCGVCGRTCVVPNASAACVASECAVGACEPGYFDDDGDVANGCELEDRCVPGGVCATACGSDGTTVCEAGVASCAIPPEICNLVDDNCNGACDEGALAGCRQPVHRGNGNGHVYSDDLAFVSTRPYSVEAAEFFFLYSGPALGMRPVFLCPKPNGKRFLSTDTACEIGIAPERTIGFWSPTPVCDSIPLYRLYNDTEGNHFYTVSAPERDNAIAAYGYRDEGIAGYVWRSR